MIMIAKLSLRLAVMMAVVLAIRGVKVGPFTAIVRTPRVQEMGEEVTCQVVITNNHDSDYYLLKRNTPLEGLKSNIFSIKKGVGPYLQYDGFHFKRAPPTRNDYVRFPARSSVSSSVVLSQAYSFDTPSIYSVKLAAPLQYTHSLTENPLSQDLISKPSHFLFSYTAKKPQLTEPEALRRKQALSQGIPDSYAFHGMWTEKEIDEASAAYDRAYTQAGASVNEVDTNGHLYAQWFGAAPKDTVKKVFKSITTVMSNYQYTLKKATLGRNCAPDIYAYTYYQSRDIFFCHQFFQIPARGAIGHDTQMGVIVHEMTHSAANTKDHAYGVGNCQQLAINNHNQAVDNADNYEYFAESF